MPQPQLYFLSNEYYQDFPDDKLMQNKDIIDGVLHSRPCFFAFPDARVPEIYWIVPISSKYEKYRRIEQDKIKTQIASSSWTPSGRKLGLPQPLRLRKQCQGMLQRVLLECSTPDSSSEGC